MLRLLGLLLGACLIGSCANFSLFGPNPKLDLERSGVTGSQMVQITYVRPGDQGELDALAGEIPAEVLRRCARRQGPHAAGVVPIVVAIGQALVDYMFDSVDRRIAQLRKAAVREYTANALLDNLSLADEDCIILIRRPAGAAGADSASRSPYSAFVFEVNTHTSESRMQGSVLVPLYARIDRAAAQTTIDENGVAKVNATVAFAISGIQHNRLTDRDEAVVLNASSFSLRALELGRAYCAPSLNMTGCAPLQSATGALFPRLPADQRPTVGIIAGTVVETGALANLDEISAADKATRASIRSVIGELIKTELSD